MGTIAFALILAFILLYYGIGTFIGFGTTAIVFGLLFLAFAVWGMCQF